MNDKPTKLYRHFAADGTLLYVGVSLNAFARLAQHADASKWFDTIANVTFESFPTRPEALAAERAAVQSENPKHNIKLRALPKETRELFDLKYGTSTIEKSAVDLTKAIVQFDLLYAANGLPIPMSVDIIWQHMDAGELGYLEMQDPGSGRVKRYVSGWQLIDFLDWLSSGGKARVDTELAERKEAKYRKQSETMKKYLAAKAAAP